MAYDVITPAKLGRGAIGVSPTVTTFTTVPVLQRDIVKTIDIANTTAASIDVTVYLVESGGSPGAANTLVPGITVPSNGMFQWSGAQVLHAGDTIQATSSASGTTINISGGEAV